MGRRQPREPVRTLAPTHFYRWEEYPLLLSVKEVALLLRVTERTVYSLVASGEIPSQKIGNKLFIDRDFFRHTLEENEKGEVPC